MIKEGLPLNAVGLLPLWRGDEVMWIFVRDVLDVIVVIAGVMLAYRAYTRDQHHGRCN